MERRAFCTQGLELRSAEERILSGVLVPYDTPTKIGRFYTETFTRGAFDGTDPADVPLLASHRHEDLPVGRTLTLTEEAHALTGEWRVAETGAGDDVMALARDGVPLSLSIGFKPINDKWSRDRSQVTRVKATLGEVSLVGMGMYEDAKVMSVRADDDDDEGAHAPSRLMIARLTRP
jgi:Escherichia/Staphylococcus phage prohead protease